MRRLSRLNPIVMLLVVGSLYGTAFALIEGGEGNTPLNDPGWPKGAAAIFNHPGRIAWWEGPPFGGGEWHSECKGDAAALNELLTLFAKIEGPKKRVVVLDGIGYSFWLDPNGTKRGDRKTKIDWSFTIWQADRWKMQQDLPPGMSAVPKDQTQPLTTITVHTASLKWSEVKVPEGIEVVDNRMEAHGFKLTDGRVIEGKVTDLAGGPLQAKVRFEELVQKKSGGYDYPVVNSIETDTEGHWSIKNFGEKWCRIVVEREGHASRIAGHVRYDRQPGWEFMATTLAPLGSLRGRVVDEQGKPLADVAVAMRDLVSADGRPYEVIEEVFQKTTAEGGFHFKNIPEGKARLTGHREDYFFPGLGQPVTIPDQSLELRMQQAASISVQVEFSRDRQKRQYIANLTPEGGEKVGSWSGSAVVNDKNRVAFTGMPPGRYLLKVHPNPSSEAERMQEQLIELKGGEEATVMVKIEVADY